MSTSTPTYITSNEAQIAVTVAGIQFPSYIKTWKSFQGGDPVAATSQLQPGAGIKAVATPGPTTRTSVVVGIPYTLDLHAIRAQLDEMTNAAMSAGYTPTDADGNPNTDAQVARNGLLNKVEVGAFDAENGKAVILQLTMETNA
jgi:hypothetical protein